MNRLASVSVISAVAALAVASCGDDPSAVPAASPPHELVGTTALSKTTASPTTVSTISSDVSTTMRPQGPASTLDGPVVTADPTGGIGEEAAVGGVLELVGGCLFLPDGDASVALVWPSGTTWEADTQTVVTGDGTRVGLGDEIEAGGGYHPGGGLIRNVSDLDGRKLAEECARLSGSGSVFVMSGLVDVTVTAP